MSQLAMKANDGTPYLLTTSWYSGLGHIPGAILRREYFYEGLHWWVGGIHYPDEEFQSQDAEQANYELVRKANEAKRDRKWDQADYREFHTVTARHSPMKPYE
jgi:hypothetical protein